MWKDQFAFAGLFFFLGSTTSVAADEFADDDSTYDGYIVSLLLFSFTFKDLIYRMTAKPWFKHWLR